jgi:hypothetical protein
VTLFTLTTDRDTFVGGPAGNTVYATAITLNGGNSLWPGDSLTGGAGTDVLALVGSGDFSLGGLASFTGFESIKLYGGTNLVSRLYLGSQSIKVDATGDWSIEVSSPSNWNGNNIINGDASHTWNTTSINFNNVMVMDPEYHYNYVVPATYDLTLNTLSHVNINVDDRVPF